MTEGILLVDKPSGKTSFSLISALRKKLNIQKIGHAGTLDPFATGVMILLVGRNYTRQSDKFLNDDKEYIAEVKLGVETDSYDRDGNVTSESDIKPTLETIEATLQKFQGSVQQIPPMFSAKKKNGKKLYELARQGKSIEREPVTVFMEVTLLEYNYPFLKIKVSCSKGTYVRSIAYDLGQLLGCGAHLTELQRTRSGKFKIENCIDGSLLFDHDYKLNHENLLFTT